MKYRDRLRLAGQRPHHQLLPEQGERPGFVLELVGVGDRQPEVVARLVVEAVLSLYVEESPVASRLVVFLSRRRLCSIAALDSPHRAHRLHDVLVSGTAAQIPGEQIDNLLRFPVVGGVDTLKRH